MVKTQQVEICLSKTETFLSFCVFNSSCFRTAATERNASAKEDSFVLLCFVYLGFGWAKRRNWGFIDGCFCKNFHARYYSRVTEKTKSVANLSHLLAFRSCISDEFDLLHFFFCRVSYGDSLDKFETMYGLVFKNTLKLFQNSFLTVNGKGEILRKT